jgi:hypothetical protein
MVALRAADPAAGQRDRPGAADHPPLIEVPTRRYDGNRSLARVGTWWRAASATAEYGNSGNGGNGSSGA